MCTDAENLMAESRNYTELLYLWVSWREATGPGAQPTFQRYVQLSNMAAHDNGKESTCFFAYDIRVIKKVVSGTLSFSLC